MHTVVPWPQSVPEDGWRWAECFLCLFPRCVLSPLSVFTRPRYLVFRGGWPDLAYGISGVWALGPKLRGQAQGPPSLILSTGFLHIFVCLFEQRILWGGKKCLSSLLIIPSCLWITAFTMSFHTPDLFCLRESLSFYPWNLLIPAVDWMCLPKFLEDGAFERSLCHGGGALGWD
jgi:hypothetical protein